MRVTNKNYFDSLENARELKERATIHEILFMNMLDEWKISYEFQKIVYVSKRYHRIVDFYLPKFNVVVEIDGPSHDHTREQDAFRTRQLKKRSIRKVVRFKNDEIFSYDPERIKQLLIVNLLA